MAIEIVSFPMKSMVIFHSYVKLPEGSAIQFMLVILAGLSCMGPWLCHLGQVHLSYSPLQENNNQT